jgi:hypothetical protein
MAHFARKFSLELLLKSFGLRGLPKLTISTCRR